jgi:hypothetical protein
MRDILSGPHPVFRKFLGWLTGKGHAMRRESEGGVIPRKSSPDEE